MHGGNPLCILLLRLDLNIFSCTFHHKLTFFLLLKIEFDEKFLLLHLYEIFQSVTILRTTRGLLRGSVLQLVLLSLVLDLTLLDLLGELVVELCMLEFELFVLSFDNLTLHLNLRLEVLLLKFSELAHSHKLLLVPGERLTHGKLVVILLLDFILVLLGIADFELLSSRG